MVEAGVAKKYDEEKMYDKDGNEVDDKKKCMVCLQILLLLTLNIV